MGKTTESDLHPNPITNPNPNPYLVAVRYGSLVFQYNLPHYDCTAAVMTVFTRKL